MAVSTSSPGWAGRLGPRLLLLWAGLSIGVAFLATPVKFMAPSLSLPVALDVGRQTFRVYNYVELVLFALLVLLGVAIRTRRWWTALALPGAVIAAQALWLLPLLDGRVSTILAGHSPPPSNLHVVYIAIEGLKVVWLLAFGLADVMGRPATRTVRSARGGHRRRPAGFSHARWKD